MSIVDTKASLVVPGFTTPGQRTMPLNYLPRHPFPHGHSGLRDEVNVSGVWKRRDKRTIRNELGREFACVENIDMQIGRVLKRLEEMANCKTRIFSIRPITASPSADTACTVILGSPRLSITILARSRYFLLPVGRYNSTVPMMIDGLSGQLIIFGSPL